jgi:enoyl-CoA hydratase/carnithine racemase
LELAACADLRIAEDHIRIGQPEPGLGIIPGWSGTQRAARRFGTQILRRMALFGEAFTADQAYTVGLVDQVVPRGQGHETAHSLATSLRHRGPVATEIAKMMINAAEGEERERVIDALAGRAAALQPELQTGLAAFKLREKADYWK